MIITSHFVATTSILLIAKKFGLNVTNEIIIWSYIFGNLIDIDHIIAVPKLGWKRFKESVFRFNRGKSEPGKYYIHSVLQEPWLFVVMIVVSSIIYLQTTNGAIFLPTIALGMHILLDTIMKFENKLLWPFSKKGYYGWLKSDTTIEYVLSVTATVLVIYFAIQERLFVL
jgi:hypothetical protein